MKRCDPRAPLMVNVTKMYPRPDASGFDSFGRVFSGQLKVGDKVSVLRRYFWVFSFVSILVQSSCQKLVTPLSLSPPPPPPILAFFFVKNVTNNDF